MSQGEVFPSEDDTLDTGSSCYVAETTTTWPDVLYENEETDEQTDRQTQG